MFAMSFRPDRLKALREAKGFSQERLAKLADVVQGTIGKCEKGATVPGSETVERLAEALDVTIDYLHGRGLEGLDTVSAASRMAFDVFCKDEGLTYQQRERCRRTLLHPNAPTTAQAWRSFSEMLDLADGPASGGTSVNPRPALVRERRSKSKS